MRVLAGFTVAVIAAVGVWIAITGIRGVALREPRVARTLRWEDQIGRAHV